jgi:cyclophilin family peptidyl-prolyl cis-trans isomerase/Tol biopolymer transport system component
MRALIAGALIALVPALARANGYEHYPSPIGWTNDQTVVVAVIGDSWPYQDSTVQGVVRMYDREGEELLTLPACDWSGPQFSPLTDDLVAFCSGEARVYNAYGYDTSASVEAEGPLIEARFSPDGGKYLTIGERFYGCDIWRVSEDGRTTNRLTHAGDSDSAFGPAGEHKGRLIHLYQAGLSGIVPYERIYATDLAAESSVQLTQPQTEGYPDGYHESNPQLAGDTLFFQRGGWGEWSVYSLDLNTGVEKLEAQDAQQPSVSADGRWLAFSRRSASHRAAVENPWDAIPTVWVKDRNSGREWRYDLALGGAEFPAISRDGNRIAWLEFSGGKVRLRIAPVTPGEARESLEQDEQPAVAEQSEAAAEDTEAAETEPEAAAAGLAEETDDATGAAALPAEQVEEAPATPADETEEPVADLAPAPDDETTAKEDPMDTSTFNVRLATTKGDIVLTVHPEWAPVGAAHFRELIEAGFYDGAPWFRVLGGFVAQCGISADPAMNAKFGEATINDEAVKQGNKPGFVAFGQSSLPNSRSTHFFINYVDNSRLDGMGFACFAEVTEGMDIARQLSQVEYSDQGRLAREGGLEDFRRRHPEADYITTATIE